jgi:hypothetical protein
MNKLQFILSDDKPFPMNNIQLALPSLVQEAVHNILVWMNFNSILKVNSMV